MTLIRATRQRIWETRPRLVAREDELARLRRIEREVVAAGFSAVRVMMFQGQPTMDLVVETPNPAEAAEKLRTVLADLHVDVFGIGRPGDLSYVRRMWRHM